jgi:hypothetical protein
VAEIAVMGLMTWRYLDVICCRSISMRIWHCGCGEDGRRRGIIRKSVAMVLDGGHCLHERHELKKSSFYWLPRI